MKKLIVMVILALTLSIAKADSIKTALIVGALDSSSSYTIQKDKYSEMIDVIKYKLPRKGYYAPVEFMEFDIPVEDQSYFLSYFKNDGYNVSLKNGKLFFDYNGHSAMRKKLDKEEKEEKEATKGLFKFVGVCFGIFCAVKMYIFYINEKAESLLNFFNDKIIEKAKKENHQGIINIYSIEKFSLKEKKEFIKKYQEYKDKMK